MQDSPQQDHLQRFIFDNAEVRGEWVQLKSTWQEVSKQRDYPAPVAHLLGEMLAAAALLTETVKIEGRLVLQIRANGPVSMMMVECTSDHTLRGLANWQGEIADTASFSELLGEGTLAITIEVVGAKQPYQGIVSLNGDNLSAVLENYFQQSEQLDTRIWLTADQQAAAGLFLQQLPGDKKPEQAENWSRINQLASTVTPQELCELDAINLLHRLFHQEPVRLLTTTMLEFACTCSRERVGETIRMLGEAEADDIIEEHGYLEAACEFCNTHYQFDKVDIAQLFNDTISPSSDTDVLH
ncbi:MAG: Hsp33 family molecular chaperone HslO [Methylophaga sp.]|nr:Hsp33 family molecular chaperone HslO [Methylophaga sp.]